MRGRHGPGDGRYLVLDRTAGTTDGEFDQLNALGFGADTEQLQTAIAERESELR